MRSIRRIDRRGCDWRIYTGRIPRFSDRSHVWASVASCIQKKNRPRRNVPIDRRSGSIKMSRLSGHKLHVSTINTMYNQQYPVKARSPGATVTTAGSLPLLWLYRTKKERLHYPTGPRITGVHKSTWLRATGILSRTCDCRPCVASQGVQRPCHSGTLRRPKTRTDRHSTS